MKIEEVSLRNKTIDGKVLNYKWLTGGFTNFIFHFQASSEDVETRSDAPTRNHGSLDEQGNKT
jgi:hypothetical protein